jgi:hypothetical protein
MCFNKPVTKVFPCWLSRGRYLRNMSQYCIVSFVLLFVMLTMTRWGHVVKKWLQRYHSSQQCRPTEYREVEAPTMFGHSAEIVVKFPTSPTVRPLHSGWFLILISFRGSVDPDFRVGLEGLGKLSNEKRVIGNRTGDLQACRRVHQQVKLLCSPLQLALQTQTAELALLYILNDGLCGLVLRIPGC